MDKQGMNITKAPAPNGLDYERFGDPYGRKAYIRADGVFIPGGNRWGTPNAPQNVPQRYVGVSIPSKPQRDPVFDDPRFIEFLNWPDNRGRQYSEIIALWKSAMSPDVSQAGQ
jgi:hypothetical protein